MAELSSITLPDGNTYDFKDATARELIPPTMTILSYGNSTWDDFIAAYNTNTIVYCRASSNSNPASGNQTRMAFIAYVNNNPPTEVQFQYYRSVSSHSATQQGDQVFIYKLNKTSGWSVTTREAISKIAAGTGLSSRYSNGTITLSATGVFAGKVTAGADATNAMDLVTLQQLQTALPSPLSSFHTVVGDGTTTSFTINHYLNTKNILVSVNITDNNITYIAPLTKLAALSQIGYAVIINSNNSITISFTSAPASNAAEISIVSAIAYSSASDQNLLRIS